MGRLWYGSAHYFTTWTGIPLQDHRAQFVCGRFHSIARFAIPASSCPLHSVCRPMAFCYPLLATSESANQTPHLLDEAEQASKAYCKEIRHSIFRHLRHICCFDRWSSRCWKQSPNEHRRFASHKLGSHPTQQREPQSDYASQSQRIRSKFIIVLKNNLIYISVWDGVYMRALDTVGVALRNIGEGILLF